MEIRTKDTSVCVVVIVVVVIVRDVHSAHSCVTGIGANANRVRSCQNV